MSKEIVVSEPKIQSSQVSILDMSAKDKINAATEMANILSEVIKKQGFSHKIQGKDYVKVEGWITLGTLLGIIPKEKSVAELPDGSYIAEVELIRADSGHVIGGASALCSTSERRWGNAEKYARRSMAVTRATGKSYRIAFGWVVGLAGFETCNAEEMPETIEEQPKEEQPKTVSADGYYQGREDQEKKLTEFLSKKNIDFEKQKIIKARMMNRHSTELEEIIKEVMS